MFSRLLPLYIAAALLLPLALYAFRRRHVRGATWYGVLLLALAFWCVSYAIELDSNDLDAKLLAIKVKYIGLVVLPVAWIAFILDFLARERRFIATVARAMGAVSAAILLLAWTNDFHGLFWGDISVAPTDGFMVLQGRGPGFWLNIVYVYAALWAGIGVLVAQGFRSPYLYRKRVAILIAATVLPWVGNVMFLAQHKSLEQIDPTPFLFTGTAVLAAIAVFKYRVLEPMPSLRDASTAVIGDGLVILDARGCIADLNKAAERILMKARADIAGRSIRELLPEVDYRPDAEWRDDLTVAGPQGDRIFDTSVTPIRAEKRRFTGFVVVLHDVTVRRDLEEQLRQAQKMEAVGKLAGGVAHDFNNLLTAIIGFATLAEDDVPSDSPARDALLQIRRSAEQAALLTRQLLAFGRRQILQPEVLDLNTVVSNVEPMLRRLIGEDVTVVTELAPALRPVRADRSQLQQVLLNLAVNARDAMPTGGVLTIRTTPAGLDAERTGDPPAPEGDYVILEVSDTGEGIEDSVLQRIFEPFFTTKALGKGTGLGLSTVYGIVKQSGGDVRVRTSPGRGSTFAVLLPSADASVISAGRPAAALQETGRGGHVQVVEDDDAVREFIVEVLSSAGWNVMAAATPAEALAIAARQSLAIDLLVTDVVMPSMHGNELAGRLVALRPALRVLFISGYGDEDIAARGLPTAGRHYLSKPFTPAQLRQHVHALLQKAS